MHRAIWFMEGDHCETFRIVIVTWSVVVVVQIDRGMICSDVSG